MTPVDMFKAYEEIFLFVNDNLEEIRKNIFGDISEFQKVFFFSRGKMILSIFSVPKNFQISNISFTIFFLVISV
jgi:hypothetical protein